MMTHLAVAGLLAATAALTPVEQATFAGDFPHAYKLIDSALAGERNAPVRFSLLLQRARVQQFARLSGQPAQDETSTMTEISRQAPAMPAELRAKAQHAQLVTSYFRQLTGAEKEDPMALQPSFARLARDMKDPCDKADAQFFAALMPQIAGKVIESAEGLEQARATALSGGCEFELSYVQRHLAEVAEVKGDLKTAAQLADDSLALRRQLGVDIYLPYSLLQTADIAAKRGDQAMAARDRAEALRIAKRLGLPAQTAAVRTAIAEARKR